MKVIALHDDALFSSLSSPVASVPGAEVPQVAGPEGPQAPAGDGGVPPGDSLRPFLCSGETK